MTNLANDLTKSRTRRKRRFEVRRFLWSQSSLPRVRKCGRRRIDSGRGVQVVVNEGVGHFANVQSCGSIHACPVCMPRIRSERAIEIESGVSSWMKRGHGAVFVTFTIRHAAGMPLAWTLGAVAESFRAVLSGRWWQDCRERYGIEGQIRALEVTHGASGWHPHLHVLFLLDRPCSSRWAGRAQRANQATAGSVPAHLERELFDRWEAEIVSRGLPAPRRGVGVVAKAVTLGNGELLRYLCKVQDGDRARGSLGLEMARGDLKTGRYKGRTAFQIVEDALETGDCADMELWHEYERATKGRNAITWSRGLKARLGVASRSDEEIVAEPIGGEVVAELPDGLYGSLCVVPGALAGLLDAAENGGTEGVEWFLAGLSRRVSAA